MHSIGLSRIPTYYVLKIGFFSYFIVYSEESTLMKFYISNCTLHFAEKEHDTVHNPTHVPSSSATNLKLYLFVSGLTSL